MGGGDALDAAACGALVDGLAADGVEGWEVEGWEVEGAIGAIVTPPEMAAWRRGWRKRSGGWHGVSG